MVSHNGIQPCYFIALRYIASSLMQHPHSLYRWNFLGRRIDPKKTNQFHQCHGWIFQLRLVNSPHWYFQKIPPRAAKQTGMYSLAASSILPKARRKCSISLKNLPEASLVSQFLLTEWSGVYFQDLGVQKNGGVHNFPTYSPKSLCFFCLSRLWMLGLFLGRPWILGSFLGEEVLHTKNVPIFGW